MKKILLSAALLLGSLGAWAQLVEINSMQRVALPQGMKVAVPTISPDGSFVVVSDLASSGLTKIDIASGKSAKVTANGSALDLRISKDGSQVVFRQTNTGADKLRYTALKSVDLGKGVERTIVAPTRNLNTGIALSGATVTAVENTKVRKAALAGTAEAAAPVVSINYGHLQYTAGGKTVTLDPQGRGSYLWPQLSPDGKKVSYYLAGRGAFVCNVDGTGVKSLGLLRAAKWLNNDILVGMEDYDNGEYVTASAIVATNLKGVRQTLTESNIIAMYPSANAQGNKIAFATAAGEVFIINLK